MQKKIYVILLTVLFPLSIYAQQLTEAQQKQVSDYTSQLEKYRAEGNKNQTANYAKKIGDIYNYAYMPKEAIPFYVEAEKLSEEIGNQTAVKIFNNQIGMLYNEVGNYAEAEKYLKKALDIAYQSNDSEQIASAQSNYASSLFKQNKFDQAVTQYEEALTIAQELKNYKMMKTTASKVAKCYKELGDEENYERYFRLTSSFNDMEKNEVIKEKEVAAERQKKIALEKTYRLKLKGLELEIVEDSLAYQEEMNAQKQMEIELLNQKNAAKQAKINEEQAKLKRKEAEIQARNNLIFGLAAIFVLILIASLIVLKLFFDKRKANKKLKVLNAELSDKNEKIEAQNKELTNKNALIENQNAELHEQNIKIEKNRKELEIKNKHITDSINYASRIQQAILPSQQSILSDFSEAFIFYLPRDIVSGDFYWYYKQNGYKFVAAVDCTGHSVPGAFMSMIGNTLLNKIIKEEKEYDPAKILTELDKGVQKNLSTYQATKHSKMTLQEKSNQLADGMDMTLCRFNEGENQVVIAAAGHDVIVIDDDSSAKIVKGDIHAIGGHQKMRDKKTFENKIVEIKSGRTFYMHSDGFPDQMGGPRGRKLMTKNFIKLLQSFQGMDLKTQKTQLGEKLNKWKGKIKQIDDILVIGIKF